MAKKRAPKAADQTPAAPGETGAPGIEHTHDGTGAPGVGHTQDGSGSDQTPTAPAQTGPTTEDLQTDAALAGGDPAFFDAEGTDAAPAETGAAEAPPGEDSAAADQAPTAPEQVKVKMKTVSAGPDPAENWTIGAIRFVEMDEAEALVKANLAELV